MDLFPILVRLRARRCVVVGAGEVAASKAEALLAAGAPVIVVAPRAGEWVQEQARAARLTWHQREFVPHDLDGTFLVIAATDSPSVNEAVFRASAERGMLCNVVDDPEHCDFFYPAVVRRGALQIAVSTSGQSPALAHRLRVELEQQFGPEYEHWVEHVGRQRREILARNMTEEDRRRLLDEIASRAAYEEFVRARPTVTEPAQKE
ncbi:MAG: bifunctional precorrin-2 dehydrogenase/sirohydrochlorin ferrochelatase [Acidobacteriia bacterium]|nr:bifunctional precorrin-2 dehydrogenase/sirohydrochlorin ferrochelatase [Terriglobia bacterium]